VTYSIVARDPSTGELGVAVQSQAFNTGAAVPWARPGVGAVATQSFTDRRYGWRGLELLASGVSPDDALTQLRGDDDLVEFRQVAMLAPDGSGAQWTGGNCVTSAGHARGDDWLAQANLVESPRVWESMGEAFETTAGSLAERLLAALDAAQSNGGDWRGRGGAGIVVVPAEGEPWERVFDLRVEEGDGSLDELRRLVTRATGYRETNRAAGDAAEIGARHGLPESHLRLLAIEDAAVNGDLTKARRLLAELAREEPRWRDLLRTISSLPDQAELKALLED
jgi:uncharacterized Ntn-hydrolase superfamily protein